MGLTLTAVAEDENIGVGLVLGSLVEVYKYITAVFVTSDIEAMLMQSRL